MTEPDGTIVVGVEALGDDASVMVGFSEELEKRVLITQAVVSLDDEVAIEVPFVMALDVLALLAMHTLDDWLPEQDGDEDDS